jgi:hypothetical protein
MLFDWLILSYNLITPKILYTEYSVYSDRPTDSFLLIHHQHKKDKNVPLINTHYNTKYVQLFILLVFKSGILSLDLN